MDSADPILRQDFDRRWRTILRIGVGVLLAAALVRAVLFLGYAMLEIPAPDQPYTLEGASVHFAWRVEQGLPLYPDGQGPSYTVNYMGPCYFWTVGWIGRWLGAGIPTLYIIGRVVTFLCAIGTAVIAALYLARRYGAWIGWAGLLFGLGAAPMIWYGARTRPDVMANFLGVAGFFLACGPKRRWLPVAALLLAISCLTKQTFGAVWLLAAAICLFLDKDTRLSAFSLVGMAVAMVSAVVAWLAATIEPNIVHDLVGQAGMPFGLGYCLRILMRLMDWSPEMLFFAIIGCGLWKAGDFRNRTLFVMTVVWLAAVLLTGAKKGSDVNYFIPLAVVETLAAGMLCIAAPRAKSQQVSWAVTVWLGAAAMIASTAFAAQMTRAAVDRQYFEAGQARRQLYARYAPLAQDPDVRLFTDSDRLAVFQGERAALIDVFLFRKEVELGRRDPQILIDQLNNRWFEYVILSADPAGVYDDMFFYALPPEVALAVRANYRLQSDEGGLLVFVPREE